MTEPRPSLRCCSPFVAQYPSGKHWTHSKFCVRGPRRNQKVQDGDELWSGRHPSYSEREQDEHQARATEDYGVRRLYPETTYRERRCPVHPSEPIWDCRGCERNRETERETRL